MDHIHRFVFEHRRVLAAVCAGLAVLAALSAAAGVTDGEAVVVASHDLASGHVITEADLDVPAGCRRGRCRLTRCSRSAAVGRRVAGPMRTGEALTDYRVLRPDALKGYRSGSRPHHACGSPRPTA